MKQDLRNVVYKPNILASAPFNLDLRAEISKRVIDQFRREGDITYQAMLIACAAIANAKEDPRVFNPIVLNGDDELIELINYININKEMLKGIAKTSFKFIHYDDDIEHWTCGVIDIESDKTKVLIVDSAGEEAFFYRSRIVSYFLENNNIEVTVSKPRTQHLSYYCPIFAIENVRKLFKLPRLSVIEDLSELNPSMLRVTQSMKKIHRYQERIEQDTLDSKVVNKRKISFMDSVNEHLGLNNKKIINQRIEYKQTKILEKVSNYLALPESDLDCTAFTLNGFKLAANEAIHAIGFSNPFTWLYSNKDMAPVIEEQELEAGDREAEATLSYQNNPDVLLMPILGNR